MARMATVEAARGSPLTAEERSRLLCSVLNPIADATARATRRAIAKQWSYRWQLRAFEDIVSVETIVGTEVARELDDLTRHESELGRRISVHDDRLRTLSAAASAAFDHAARSRDLRAVLKHRPHDIHSIAEHLVNNVTALPQDDRLCDTWAQLAPTIFDLPALPGPWRARFSALDRAGVAYAHAAMDLSFHVVQAAARLSQRCSAATEAMRAHTV